MEECDILVYDITDSDAARKTFVAMLDEPLVDQVISGHASDDSVAEMFDGFRIKGMHVTTCDDNCASIISNGILPLCEVLSRGCALGKFLEEHLEIDLRDNAQLLDSSSLKALPPLIRSKLRSDNRVSAYLHSVSKDEGYYERPEFLHDCVSQRPFEAQRVIESKWREGKSSFCVYFEVPFQNVSTISYVYAADEQEGGRNANWLSSVICELLCLARKVGEGEVDSSIVMTLKPGLIVSPEFITDVAICP